MFVSFLGCCCFFCVAERLKMFHIYNSVPGIPTIANEKQTGKEWCLFVKYNTSRHSQLMMLIVLSICFPTKVTSDYTTICEIWRLWNCHFRIVSTTDCVVVLSSCPWPEGHRGPKNLDSYPKRPGKVLPRPFLDPSSISKQGPLPMQNHKMSAWTPP